MFRFLLLVHRYLGIAVGLVVALWCLSGFVMMYVQYPELRNADYLAGLPAIDAANCCKIDADVLGQLDNIDEITIEMLAGQAVLRARFGVGVSVIVDLGSGTWFSTISSETAMQQADAFLTASGLDGEARYLVGIERDQWTVSGAFDVHRPLYLVSVDDDAGTQLYVSGVSGQLVQATSARERFWNRLGAVIHWIYPAALRQNVALWSQVVIWLSIASLFLVVVGLCLGTVQYGSRPDGSRSPYRGLNLWHHYAGLAFGIFTLAWLFSGLLSMNPWGTFEGEDGLDERHRLAGGSIASIEVAAIVAALDETALPPGTVQLRSSMFDGKLVLIARDATGNATRLDVTTFTPEPLAGDAWNRVASLARPGVPIRDAGLLDSGDAYYFNHHEQLVFPVYRIVFDDVDRTHYYFDPVSAELLQKYDGARRWHRWLFLGLHRGDFTAALRRRPLWDLIMLPLLLGVTIGALSGVWMAWRRVTK